MTAPTPNAPASSPSYGQTQSVRKSPIIAALLSFFLFGIGYLYLGYKKVLGVPTIVFVVLMLIVYIVLAAFTFGLLELVPGLLLGYDSYVKAKGQRGILEADLQ